MFYIEKIQNKCPKMEEVMHRSNIHKQPYPINVKRHFKIKPCDVILLSDSLLFVCFLIFLSMISDFVNKC